MTPTASTRRRGRIAVAAILVAALTVLGAASSAATNTDDTAGPRPTIVLVHGAFADASGWNDVITRLQRRGYNTIAPANPLRGLPGDAAYLSSVLDTIDGPVVLVGHSYGGMVMTNAAAARTARTLIPASKFYFSLLTLVIFSASKDL